MTPALPDLPSLDEAGLKGYEVTSWFGLNAPAATPKEVVAKLNAALNKSMTDPKTKELFESRGATVITGTSEQYVAFVKAESAKWAPIVKRAGVKAE